MNAIRFAQYGEPAKVLAVEGRPLPQPEPGEAHVRIPASPVDPSDLLFVCGHLCRGAASVSAPVGFEGVGCINALGSQIDRPLRPGQGVGVVNGRGGNWAEYAVVPVGDLLSMPAR